MKTFFSFVVALFIFNQIVATFGQSSSNSIAVTNIQNEKVISITTNDVISITGYTGDKGLLRFTKFTSNKAFYQWRYRSSTSNGFLTGNGIVVESYDRKPSSSGGYQVIPKTENDTTLRVGEFKMEWSIGSLSNGWLYYDPTRIAINLLSPEAFHGDL